MTRQAGDGGGGNTVFRANFHLAWLNRNQSRREKQLKGPRVGQARCSARRLLRTSSERAEEVANVALFLASEESSYVTAVDIVVDGGMKVW